MTATTDSVRPRKPGHPVRRVLALDRPYRGRLILSQIVLLLSAIGTLGTAARNAGLVNDGLLAGDTGVILDTGLWMAVLGVAAGLFLAGVAVIAVFFSQGTAYLLRTRAYESVQRFSFGNFDGMRTGNLLVRLNSDVSNVANAVLFGVMLLLYAPFMLIVSLALAVFTAPGMVWILVVVAVVVLAASVLLVRPMERAYATRQKRLDEVNNARQENLAGVRVVKAFGREQLERERFGARTDALRRPAAAAAFRVALLAPIMNTVTQLGIAVTLAVDGHQVVSGDGTTIGQVTAFTQYLSLVVVPLALAALIAPYLLRGITSARRVFEVIDTEPVLAVGGSMDPTTTGGARIVFENVSFGYVADDARHDVLRGIDLVIEPGQSVGILGATGSGKTSLVNLVPRFYDPAKAGSPSTVSTSASCRSIGCDRSSAPPSRRPCCFRATFERTSGSPIRRHRMIGSRRPPGRQTPTTSSRLCPSAGTPRSPVAATTSAAASVSACRWPARSCRDRECSSSTTRPAPSTSPPRPGCRPPSRTTWRARP